MINSNNLSPIEGQLLAFGLTAKQARVYLAALQLGTASVQQIATAAQTERTNAYDAIAALLERRLMSTTGAGKRTFYTAEPPERLNQLLSEQQMALKRLLPQLNSLYNVSESKPRIRYYPGIEGYKAAYEDTLTCGSKLLFGVYSVRDVLEVAGKSYVDNITARRVQAGITLRIVRSREREYNNIYPATPAELREIRFAPAGMVFPIITFVYDNKTIYLSSKKETFGLIIESGDVAQAHLNYFEALWRISEVK